MSSNPRLCDGSLLAANRGLVDGRSIGDEPWSRCARHRDRIPRGPQRDPSRINRRTPRRERSAWADRAQEGAGWPHQGLVARTPSIGGAENGPCFSYPPTLPRVVHRIERFLHVAPNSLRPIRQQAARIRGLLRLFFEHDRRQNLRTNLRRKMRNGAENRSEEDRVQSERHPCSTQLQVEERRLRVLRPH